MAEKSIDIAKETSVLSGTEALKAAVAEVKSDTTAAKSDCAEVKTKIGSSADSGTATVFGKINKLLTEGGISVSDVKAYLNSTVGTSGEKSLDKIIGENYETIIAPSVEVIKEIITESQNVSTSTPVLIGTYTAEKDGIYELHIKVDFRASSSSFGAYLGYAVNKTITKYIYQNADKYVGIDRNAAKEYSFSASLKKGDIFRVYASASSESYPLTVLTVTLSGEEVFKRHSAVIKSIQSGTWRYDRATTEEITISPVSLMKAVVLVNGGGYYSGSQYYGVGVMGYLRNPTTLVVGACDSINSMKLNWQVVEFY